MVPNPVYAGYYAYGRRQVEPRRKVPGRPSTGRVVKEAGEWLGVLPGRRPAFIKPEAEEANGPRAAANPQAPATPGPPTHGPARLSGLPRFCRGGRHGKPVPRRH